MEQIPSSDDQARRVYLLNSLRTHSEGLSRLQQEAHAAYQRIYREKDITSPQCIRIITPLLPLDHPVIHLKNFLEHPLHFSSIDTQRQQLLIALDQIDVYIKQLQQQTTLFAQTNFQSSIETGRIRENILGIIQTIDQKLLDFNHRLIKILETTILQEQLGSPDVSDQSPTSLEEICQPALPSSPPTPILSVEKVLTSDSVPIHQKYYFILISSQIILYMKKIFSAILEIAISRTRTDMAKPVNIREIPYVISTETPEQHMQRLYDIAKFTSAQDIREICLKLSINYDSLTDNSHINRVLSLVQHMYNKKRLDDLERELREIMPNRFLPDDPGT